MSDSIEDRIHRSRQLLQNPYAYLDGDGEFTAKLPRPETVLRPPQSESASRIASSKLLAGKKRGDRFSRDEIEAVARRLHLELWERRSELLRDEVAPLDVVDPSLALSRLGFEVIEDRLLGDVEGDGELLGIAGMIDRDNARVSISPRFPVEIQRFTLAHELGHVVLHQGTGLHRDRGLDGSRGSLPTSPVEAEANHFAAAFLMPAKLVCAEFLNRFLTERFVMNEDAAFGLGDRASLFGRKGPRNRRALCRLLARAEHFHGTHFLSLARRFQVSESTMAIRLEELGLVDC